MLCNLIVMVIEVLCVIICSELSALSVQVTSPPKRTHARIRREERSHTRAGEDEKVCGRTAAREAGDPQGAGQVEDGDGTGALDIPAIQDLVVYV